MHRYHVTSLSTPLLLPSKEEITQSKVLLNNRTVYLFAAIICLYHKPHWALYLAFCHVWVCSLFITTGQLSSNFLTMKEENLFQTNN